MEGGANHGTNNGANNGGFPEPPAGEAVRLVRCQHDACGAATRVRLPQVLPAKVVRRVVCDGCREPFECRQVLDIGVAQPGRSAATAATTTNNHHNHSKSSGGLFGPQGRAWQYLSVPLGAAAVVGVLALVQHLA